MKEKTKISAEIVADSTNSQGDRLTSLLITFPRIILAEVNTHRMLSKNTSSSRAIPFNKMVESVENDPFIPIAWQKPHRGMQGAEYYDHTLTEGVGGLDYTNLPRRWLRARNTAVSMAKIMTDETMNMPITKQLANRLLEPFMWTTMLITGSKEGWDNFFELRCPSYDLGDGIAHKSKKDALKYISHNNLDKFEGLFITETDWLLANKGQAEIHIMDLAEKIYDAMNENTPKQLEEGEWHIPFEDKINNSTIINYLVNDGELGKKYTEDELKVCISTAMAARTSYTVVGGEKEINYERMVELHDRLLAQDPPHSSPMEHCARAMSDEEYLTNIKGKIDADEYQLDNEDGFPNYVNPTGITIKNSVSGWCRNYKGFIQYRHIIENK